MGTVSLPDAKRKKEPKTGSHWFKLSSTPENTRNILYPCIEKPASQWLTGLLAWRSQKMFICVARNPGITLYLNHTGSYKIFRLEL